MGAAGHGNCFDMIDRLFSYLDGEVPEGEAGTLREHLSRCEPCRAYLQSIRATREASGSLGTGTPCTDEESEAIRVCMEALRERLGPRPS